MPFRWPLRVGLISTLAWTKGSSAPVSQLANQNGTSPARRVSPYNWTTLLPITAGARETSANNKKRLVPICSAGSTRWLLIEVVCLVITSPRPNPGADPQRSRLSAKSQSELGRPVATWT